MRIRKEASQAASDLQWYARAITHLKAYPVPGTGLNMWELQSRMHASITVAGQPIECVHGSWFFLPWHRAYLRAFESVVAEAVVREGGPQDWALPYWNYGNAATRDIPSAFRQPAQPSNPLWVQGRNPNAPSTFAANSTSCLNETSFSATDGVFGFGGPPAGMVHTGQSGGACEERPHDTVHSAIGGVMGTFNSPRDPIFWLHHANVDRLWEVWRARHRDPQGHLPDPTSTTWLQQQFRFLQYDGTPVAWTGAQLLDTPALGYKYDPDPLAAPAPALVRGRAGVRALSRDRPAPAVEQMLGASDQPVHVSQEPASVEIETEAPEVPRSRSAFSAMATRGPRFFLRLESVRSPDGIPRTYAAYLNLAPGGDPDAHPQLLAGLIPGFGVLEASANGGPGVTKSLDVTAVVNYLSREGAWDASVVRVTLVPYGSEPAPAATPTSDHIEIGRVSLHVL